MTNFTSTLLISCPDSSGLVAKIVNFYVYDNDGKLPVPISTMISLQVYS